MPGSFSFSFENIALCSFGCCPLLSKWSRGIIFFSNSTNHKSKFSSKIEVIAYVGSQDGPGNAINEWMNS